MPARRMTAKFNGRCAAGKGCKVHAGGKVFAGETIYWFGRGATYHVSCYGSGSDLPKAGGEPDEANRPVFEPEDSADRYERYEAAAARRRDDAEYAAGVADANRYLSDKAIYGEALAEAWAFEEEMARYNRGEDY